MNNADYNAAPNIGLPKNEGCTRNFLGRGNAAKQAIEFIF